MSNQRLLKFKNSWKYIEQMSINKIFLINTDIIIYLRNSNHV